MKILFTGASSFTGFWFVQELVQAGHEVTCCLRRESYEGLRKERVDQLPCRIHFGCSFGSEKFLKKINEENWDLFCQHAADVENYKSPDFNVAAALANNTNNLKKVLQMLLEKGCSKLLLTGSVFEQQEGEGIAVSPYGLSKGVTSDVFPTIAKF